MSHFIRFLTVAVALSISVGCQNSLRNVAKATAGTLEPPNVPPRENAIADATAPPATTPYPTTGLQSEPLVEPTREQAFQQVLGDLQAIGRQSPAAQQELLAQLENTDPAYWSALAERKRSTLLYQQQIASQNTPTDVIPAASHQRTADSTHDHVREARVNPIAEPSPALDHGAMAAPLLEGLQRLTSGEPRTQTIHDPAVQQTAAMVFPGPDSDRITPYPITPHREIKLDVDPPVTAHAYDSTLDPLQDEIDRRAALLNQRPQSIAEAYDHVRLHLLQLAADDLDNAAEPPPGLTSNEQQYWSNQLLAVSTLLDHRTHPEARRRAAAAGMHLKHAVSALEQLGSLTVTNLTFCKKVYGFGTYDKLESTQFKPGQEVSVYAEVENYKSVETPQGMHTSLATSYRVLDQHGGRVEQGEAPVVNDFCATRRRDFHIQYGITLPQGIYPGQYLLEFTLTDQLGDKIGHGQLEFEIVDTKQR